MAKGKWIGFVDADDWIHPQLCQIAAEHEDTDAEFFCFQLKNVYEKNSGTYDKLHWPISGQVMDVDVKEMIAVCFGADKTEPPYCLSTPCGKLYSRQFLLEHKIYFPNDVKIGEDLLFNIQVYAMCKKWIYYSEVLYFYLQNKNSAMHNYRPDAMGVEKKFNLEAKRIISEFDLMKDCKDIIRFAKLQGAMNVLDYYIFHRENKMSRDEITVLLLELVQSEEYKEIYFCSFNEVKKWMSLKRRIILSLLFKRNFRILTFLYWCKNMTEI